MRELLKYMDTIIDTRQPKKVKHKLKDIIILVLFGMLANATTWEEYEYFGKEHEEFLCKYIELPNGIPSHDTIQRVMAMISSNKLGEIQQRWNEMLNTDNGQKLQKILAIDGKTQCGNGNKNQRPNHIVSAVDENGFCIGQKMVNKKSNEITAIPELLETLNVKGNIITTDALGTQIKIAQAIRKKRADYVLALKKNQSNLYDDVELYFKDQGHLKGCEYTKTMEKARGGIEKREYWHTDDIKWLSQKKDWAGLKTIAMTRNTTTKDGVRTEETRYFISSLACDVNTVARAIRKHWMVESYHWHLDVTFREDANQTLEKQAAYNLNILRKFALNILKLYDSGRKRTSLKMKRYMISLNPIKRIVEMLDM